MDDARKRVERKLLQNLLIDWCETFAAEEDFLFSASDCSNDGTLRLSSPSLEGAFPPLESGEGAWGNGRLAYYEVFSDDERMWRARLVVSDIGLGKAGRRTLGVIRDALRGDAPVVAADDAELDIIRQWDIGSTEELNGVVELVDQFARTELLYFEHELASFLEGGRSTIRDLPASDKRIIESTEIPETIFAEGAQLTILGDRYERNRAARARCIAEHGARCAICGFDFGAVYGDDYSGKIEVHHIVPLSKIREEHVVDPVKDLIPVCPNCHLILHSKGDGDVFTPDEVRAMISRGREGSLGEDRTQ